MPGEYRALNIDRALAVRAREASLSLVEVPGSAQDVGGILQGCIYACQLLGIASTKLNSTVDNKDGLTCAVP